MSRLLSLVLLAGLLASCGGSDTGGGAQRIETEGVRPDAAPDDDAPGQRSGIRSIDGSGAVSEAERAARYEAAVAHTCEQMQAQRFATATAPVFPDGYWSDDFAALDPPVTAQSMADAITSCLDQDDTSWSASIDRYCATAIDAATLASDPNAHEGTCVTGHGVIVQYDDATGPCSFHADIDNVRVQLGSGADPAGQAAERECAWLRDCDENDAVEFWATVVGANDGVPALSLWRTVC